MALEQVTQFFSRLDADSSLRGEVDATESIDDVISIGQKAGFTFNAAELFEAALKSSGFGGGEQLSEAQLAAVAGGTGATIAPGSENPIAWLSRKKGFKLGG